MTPRNRGKIALLLGTIGLGAWLSLGAGCRRGGALVFRGAPVVLISVDTLRADHLPAYGYRGVATPNLDALASDAIVFTNAYSHVPLTLPSHASLFTGLLPPQNGVRDNIGYPLAVAPETLAAFLKKQGFATGGAVSSVILSHSTGISRGFDFYEDSIEPTAANQSLGRVQRNGADTEGALEHWVDTQAGQKFFAFSPSLRAAHALRPTRALQKPLSARLRRRDRAGGPDCWRSSEGLERPGPL